MKLPDKVAIIGVGLIGGSIGLALKELDEPPKVLGISRNPDTLRKALERGAVDEASHDLEAAGDADLVFVATPVRTIEKTVARILPLLKPGAIVTDVGSTKKEIVEAIESVLPPGINFIGGHPMAGSEAVGIDNATADLMSGAVYLLTPTEKTDSKAYEILHNTVNAMGARPFAINPEEHDKAISIVSHLPHLLSTALVSLAGRVEGESGNLLMFSAGGFRDMTRLAASSPEVWLDIFLTNRVELTKALAQYQEELSRWREMIEGKREEGLLGSMNEARGIRTALPGAPPLLSEQLHWLLVQVSDKPGAISDVTLAIGKKGINIEDLRMIHQSEGRAQLQMAFEGRERAEEVAALLKEKDYDIQFSLGES